MNEKLGSKIGEGGCSEVFEWENKEKIIKLAKRNTIYDAVSREYHNHLKAWENGLPVPQPFEFVNLNGRPGIVLERIYGESLMARFIRQIMERSQRIEAFHSNEGNTMMQTTARLLVEVHSKSNLEMPSQRKMLNYSIGAAEYLNAAEKENVIGLLDRLPEKRQLCHGDPNPGNILIRDGKAVMIDWMNATIGNPEADIAEYIIMIRYAILPYDLPAEVL